MARTAKYIEIDGSKLAALLRQAHITQCAASREIGFCSNYLTNAICKGKISPISAKMLEAKYAIKLNDYRVMEDKPEQAPIEEKTIAGADFKAAMYEAVKRAMLDVFKAVGEAKKRVEELQ